MIVDYKKMMCIQKMRMGEENSWLPLLSTVKVSL